MLLWGRELTSLYVVYLGLSEGEVNISYGGWDESAAVASGEGGNTVGYNVIRRQRQPLRLPRRRLWVYMRFR